MQPRASSDKSSGIKGDPSASMPVSSMKRRLWIAPLSGRSLQGFVVYPSQMSRFFQILRRLERDSSGWMLNMLGIARGTNKKYAQHSGLFIYFRQWSKPVMTG
jgi:hypothetical protein